jgi:hypothetical protein
MSLLGGFAPAARQVVVRAGMSGESVRILRRCGVDLTRLWTDLRRWHRAQ